MTDTTATSTTRDPAEIERDIRRTQDEMSRTVDRLGDQLTPRNILNALLDRAENNDIDADMLLDGARRNPLALAMIAGGAIWLVSDSDAKLPSMSGLRRRRGWGSQDTSSVTSASWEDETDPYHRDYTAHMERVEWRDDEDMASYQRRRDIARANYFMIERGHEEDDHSFRKRLDDAAEAFRAKRHAWAESGRQAGSSLRDGARNAGSSLRSTGNRAASGAGDLYQENPIIGGLVAAVVGAVAGAALPLTRTEEQQLASVGQQARSTLGEQKDHLVATAREKKDELVSKAEERVSQTGGTQGGSQGGGTAQPAMSSATSAGGPVSTQSTDF